MPATLAVSLPIKSFLTSGTGGKGLPWGRLEYVCSGIHEVVYRFTFHLFQMKAVSSNKERNILYIQQRGRIYLSLVACRNIKMVKIIATINQTLPLLGVK